MRDRLLDQRTRRGDERRRMIVEAVLASCREGNFRPTLPELAGRSGIPKGSIVKLFGALPLLYRVVARERAGEVAEAARQAMGGFFLPDGLSWLVMVGRKRDLP